MEEIFGWEVSQSVSLSRAADFYVQLRGGSFALCRVHFLSFLSIDRCLAAAFESASGERRGPTSRRVSSPECGPQGFESLSISEGLFQILINLENKTALVPSFSLSLCLLLFLSQFC